MRKTVSGHDGTVYKLNEVWRLQTQHSEKIAEQKRSLKIFFNWIAYHNLTAYHKSYPKNNSKISMSSFVVPHDLTDDILLFSIIQVFLNEVIL